ncbi:hypothetical protein CWC39_10150 [Corynebacterium heidelbergense]|uniref:Uncharacterized protein n=1 Tax=Corynebacterium heidelbergense TaxID=2055947 RepID=A0A364V892_9CORY|nr:hypothetical protein CWC39_10150 [Corynebacterium heidelbergense]
MVFHGQAVVRRPVQDALGVLIRGATGNEAELDRAGAKGGGNCQPLPVPSTQAGGRDDGGTSALLGDALSCEIRTGALGNQDGTASEVECHSGSREMGKVGEAGERSPYVLSPSR